jgi:protein-L-isoaspartate(D-aspartate) O-methyltransferase
VISLEVKPALAKMAADNLRRSGAANVSVVQADGAHGYAAEAPFDAIMLSGSVSKVPDGLLRQLKPGGRLVAVEGGEPVMEAVRYTANADGTTSRVSLFDLDAPRLHGFPEPARFHF